MYTICLFELVTVVCVRVLCASVCYEMENEFLTQFVLDGFQDAV